MWIALVVIAAILLGGLIYLASLDGRLRVRRSLEVEAPLEAVFAAIVDFRSWPEWSPWLLHEPDTELVYSPDFDREGGYYCWDGKVIGAGKLTHVSIKPHSAIRQQIEFQRPFRASNQVNWEFEARGEHSLVSWEMEGRMPFPLRFMAQRMEPMIEHDYDLGLALLNGYLNQDAAHPELSFGGRQTLENFSYWSIPCHGNLRQLEASRQNHIETLYAAAAGKTGLALTLYQDFAPMAANFRAEVAIPITDATPRSNYTRREFEGGDYFQLMLRGDHRFLPLAWHALYCHCRMHKIKIDRARAALEIYHDDPAETADSNQIRTALYLATRA